MRSVVFGGTDFTIAILEKLQDIGHLPCAVVTIAQQYEISTHKNTVANSRYSDVKGWCEERDIPSYEFDNIDNTYAFLSPFAPEFGLLAGWYFMIPERMRNLFSKGCAGFHASLLPKYRGNAPLNWALLNGETETGMSMFEVSKGVDTGRLYGQKKFSIENDDDIGDLIKKSIHAAHAILETTMPAIVTGKYKLKDQKGTPSYGLTRTADDGLIHWRCSADDIGRLIRAVTRPYPGAFSYVEGQKIIIWKARKSNVHVYGIPGQITFLDGKDSPHIVCADGLLEILDATNETGNDATPLLKSKSQHRLDLMPISGYEQKA